MSVKTITAQGKILFVLRVVVASGVLLLLSAGLHPTWEWALSALMIGTMLCWLAQISTAGGSDLTIAVAGLYFLPSTLINVPEGVLFDVLPVGLAPLAMVMPLFAALTIGVVVTALFGRWRTSAPPTPLGLSLFGLIWRLGAATALFVACYIAAGMAILPFVKDFYQGRTLPGMEPIVAMQILRALALVVAARLTLRHVPGHRSARWLLALAFPVIGDVSLMIPPNDLMPPEVRLVHALEMLPYYALCGYVFAVWFGPRRNA